VRKRKPTTAAQKQAANERERKSRRERKLIDQGYRKRELWLPDAIFVAWQNRERSSDHTAPLQWQHFDGDMVDILLAWAVDLWLSPDKRLMVAL
jgi:hypothetical protein